ncbi:head GIN domain-containing protein [Sphaerotilaceae bacterium SBD11-9]
MNTLVRFGAGLWLALAATCALAAPESRVYAPGPFERLEVDGSAEITLVQADRDQVIVPGGDDVQQLVEIRLSGNRLRINPGGGWKFWNSARLQIEVQMRQPTHVILSGNSDLHAAGPIKGEELLVGISGAGLARFDELNVGRLRLDISGAGDAQLAGQVDNMSLSVSGKGKVLAEPLRVRSASVTISGVGNASLWVTESLRVSVSGVGSVDYWGQPSVKRAISGVGNVTARGDKQPR